MEEWISIVQYTWVVKNTQVNHKMTEFQNMKLMVVLWFKKSHNTLLPPFKSSNIPAFKNKKQCFGNLLQSKQWPVVWDGEILKE